MRCLLIICLFVLAGHRVDSAPQKSEGSVDRDCVPGTSWKQDCNTCTCGSNGVGLCTQIGCLGPVKPPTSVLPSGKQCLPGSSWKSQCNFCSCGSNGIATCTLAFCSGYENEPDKSCAPNTAWKNDCNTCHCTTTGQPVCTKRGCLSKP